MQAANIRGKASCIISHLCTVCSMASKNNTDGRREIEPVGIFLTTLS